MRGIGAASSLRRARLESSQRNREYEALECGSLAPREIDRLYITSRQDCLMTGLGMRLCAAVALVLLFANPALAETVAGFSSKSDSEKNQIIETVVRDGLKHLASPVDLQGARKSQETLTRHRDTLNLIRVLFNKELATPTSRPALGVNRLKQYLDYASKNAPDETVWSIFVIYGRSEFEDYYTNATGDWKKDFSSKSDKDQQTRFAIEIYDKLVNEQVASLEKKAEQQRQKARAAQAEMDAAKAQMDKHTQTISEIDDLLAGMRASQTAREALLDMLILGAFADGTRSVAESDVIQKVLAAFTFKSEQERRQFSDAASARARSHARPAQQMKSYAAELMPRFDTLDRRRAMLALLNDVVTADGVTTDEERQLLAIAK
jgi:uncharacterized tellurite resistance protein B-like protein